MKIKTSELTGAALDWAVNYIDALPNGPGMDEQAGAYAVHETLAGNEPSFHWDIGGPLIEQHKIRINPFGGQWQGAVSNVADFRELVFTADGPTPLIAAMRALVAAKLGDEIEVPDELAQSAADAEGK